MVHKSETPEEKAERLGVVLIPKISRRPIPDSPSNNIIAVCGECGLTVHQVMGYVCPHGTKCPTGLSGTIPPIIAIL
jgi:hypothetical protein